MAKKKLSKSSGPSSSLTTIPSTAAEAEEMMDLLAHLIIGLNAYLDISTVHVALLDNLAFIHNQEDAMKLGQYIAKTARISIPSDAPGGLQ